MSDGKERRISIILFKIELPVCGLEDVSSDTVPHLFCWDDKCQGQTFSL
jgi:hypothetical protein